MSYQEPLGRAGYIRPFQGRILAGVCAGVARRWGMAPWTARVLFLLLALLPGPILVVYVLLWIFMPAESEVWRPEPPRP
ncbi:MAG: PspC domain-containing protein [Actinobacteria bacterium]|nr:PspC domain-containing protein [Actinomycetota bacterium]MCG2799157.1 PspC domain-containing protein [Cellulomonas sp.]